PQNPILDNDFNPYPCTGTASRSTSTFVGQVVVGTLLDAANLPAPAKHIALATFDLATGNPVAAAVEALRLVPAVDKTIGKIVKTIEKVVNKIVKAVKSFFKRLFQ